MALIRSSAALVLASVLTMFTVVTAAGCSARATAERGTRAAPKKAARLSAPARADAAGQAPATAPPTVSAPAAALVQAPAVEWRSFSHTNAALRGDIAARADAMKQGPIGNRGVELASLRLAASGRDLIDAGSLDGALEALQRAVSLYGRNGYAYLYLAYVHHEQGRQERAAEFAASAGRYLREDKAVAAELDGLTAAIRSSTATAGS